MIVGDVNLDLLDEEDKVIDEYNTVLASSGFYKCINSATREEYKNNLLTSTCIDHIFVKFNNIYLKSVDYKTKISDHYLIAININLQTIKHQLDNLVETPALQRKVINEKKLRRLLKENDWNAGINYNDSIKIYNHIEQSFKTCYDKASYMKSCNVKRKRSNNKSWMADDLFDMLKERDNLFKKWKNCKNMILKNMYRVDYNVQRNKVNSQINSRRLKYYRDLIQASRNN